MRSKTSRIMRFDNDDEATSSANVLKFLPELQQISFSVKVTDIGIKSVLAGPENVFVQRLSFQCPNMTDAAIGNIGQLRSLESILFQSSGITDKGLRQLNDLKGLKSLYLHEDFWAVGGRNANRTRFGLSGYCAIAQQRNLVNVRLKGYVVTDECALCLHDSASLRKLDFVYCVISSEALAGLRIALPDCVIRAIHCMEPDAPKPDWF
jgi:hypothetical protein